MLIYILLLSIQVPANIVCLIIASYSVASGGRAGIPAGVYLLLAALYWAAVAALGIRCIVRSFRAFARQDSDACFKGMLTLKYGLIPFFLINFISITFLFLTAFVASRGTILFALPVIVGLIAFGSLCTWLAMLPGAFYGVQTIRMACRMGRIGPKAALLHGILQFIFLLDVLDAVYLSLVTFRAARPVSLAVFGLSSAGFACGILFLLQIA